MTKMWSSLKDMIWFWHQWVIDSHWNGVSDWHEGNTSHLHVCYKNTWWWLNSLQWRLNEGDGISNHQPHNCLLNCLFRCRSKKTSKLCSTGLCEGNSPVANGFLAQRTSYMENVSIWWRHHVSLLLWKTHAITHKVHVNMLLILIYCNYMSGLI